MGRWKLATVLLGASFLAALVCILAATRIWDYSFPRTAFLNGAFFFAMASVPFFIIALFLDDISEWIARQSSSFFRGLASLAFALSFSVLMLAGLYLIAAGGRSLSELHVCGFDRLDDICTRKQGELSEADLQRLKKSLEFHLSLGGLRFPENVISAFAPRLKH